ncbi:hypothetical protein, partial [Streptomyces sp. NPDC059018]|uniref:hypothetical protein n=1 Tax=Streptomyces sp. NPDC059018 TaxID=3346701 RepID=UPI0036A6F2CB
GGSVFFLKATAYRFPPTRVRATRFRPVLAGTRQFRKAWHRPGGDPARAKQGDPAVAARGRGADNRGGAGVGYIDW